MGYTLEESTGSEDRTPIPGDTTMEAVVAEVKEQDSRWLVDDDDPSKGKKREISFRFAITEEGEFNDRWVWGSTPPWFNDSPKCKFRIWVQEILGVDELPVGFNVELDDLVGAPVRIHIGQGAKGGNYVADVLRIDEDSLLDEEAF